MDNHILLDRCCVEFVFLLLFKLQFSIRNQMVTFYLIHFFIFCHFDTRLRFLFALYTQDKKLRLIYAIIIHIHVYIYIIYMY